MLAISAQDPLANFTRTFCVSGHRVRCVRSRRLSCGGSTIFRNGKRSVVEKDRAKFLVMLLALASAIGEREGPLHHNAATVHKAKTPLEITGFYPRPDKGESTSVSLAHRNTCCSEPLEGESKHHRRRLLPITRIIFWMMELTVLKIDNVLQSRSVNNSLHG